MKVELISYTQNAEALLIFSKNTRHLEDVSSFEKFLDDFHKVDIEKELGYVFNTIGSSWEFINYVFLIKDVTRAFTHQFVRHRVGVSFAQQSLRVADAGDFDYLATGNCIGSGTYGDAMSVIKNSYKKLISFGVNQQDARGILPTNILTNILFGGNLRSISEMISSRLCFRTQNEFREVVKKMRSEVLKVHPWATKILTVCCIKNSLCPWGNYDGCPMKSKYPDLFGKTDEEKMDRVEYFENLDFDPQPEV